MRRGKRQSAVAANGNPRENTQRLNEIRMGAVTEGLDRVVGSRSWI
jgi:hypothetical protein